MSQASKLLESFRLFVAVREYVFELREESFGVLSFYGASLLLEVAHTGPFAGGEGVVDDVLVVFLGERWF